LIEDEEDDIGFDGNIENDDVADTSIREILENDSNPIVIDGNNLDDSFDDLGAEIENTLADRALPNDSNDDVSNEDSGALHLVASPAMAKTTTDGYRITSLQQTLAHNRSIQTTTDTARHFFS